MISVITPAHAACNPYLGEVYQSLRAQTHAPWEWVVLTNHGGLYSNGDHRVRVIEAPSELTGVGALKRFATECARGDVIVELDGDDLLAPTALERVAQAFAFGADMVYSDFAEFHDRTWRSNVYGAQWGWHAYPFTAPNGAELAAMSAPPCTPQNVRSVMWAPNHVRAWKREHALKRRVDLEVGDDQALFLDLYLSGARVVHVPECLYLYRVHPSNTVKTHNAAIQRVDADLYSTHVEALALKFARENGLAALDLCGGLNTRKGFTAVDASVGEWPYLHAVPPCQLPPSAVLEAKAVACDLDRPWPFEDGTVGVLRASDALEHLKDPIHVMNEAWRVLAPGGFFLTHTPSTEGLGAWCDPTHVSFWNALSWRYYTDPTFAKYIPAYKGRFALSRPPRRLDYGSGLIYTEAHLIALKEGYHHMGVDLWR